jgi:hypothetical protein
VWLCSLEQVEGGQSDSSLAAARWRRPDVDETRRFVGHVNNEELQCRCCQVPVVRGIYCKWSPACTGARGKSSSLQMIKMRRNGEVVFVLLSSGFISETTERISSIFIRTTKGSTRKNCSLGKFIYLFFFFFYLVHRKRLTQRYGSALAFRKCPVQILANLPVVLSAVVGCRMSSSQFPE